MTTIQDKCATFMEAFCEEMAKANIEPNANQLLAMRHAYMCGVVDTFVTIYEAKDEDEAANIVAQVGDIAAETRIDYVMMHQKAGNA